MSLRRAIGKAPTFSDYQAMTKAPISDFLIYASVCAVNKMFDDMDQAAGL